MSRWALGLWLALWLLSPGACQAHPNLPSPPPPRPGPARPLASPEASRVEAEVAPQVAVLRCDRTLRARGWRGGWELSGLEGTLRRLGLPARWLTPEEVERGGWESPLLVLPDVRSMSPATAEAIRRGVASGGRILAFYQTSYRDEENHQLQPPRFRLADLFGVDARRWLGASSEEVWLEAAGIEGGIRFPLGRVEVMLCQPRPGATVLARWRGQDLPTALVEGPGGIYVGASLFAPENSDSPEVHRLLAALFERLLPGWQAPPVCTGPARPAWSAPPAPSLGADLEGGQEIRVGLAPVEGGVRVRAARGVRYPGGSAAELEVRRVDTIGRPPSLALYSPQGRLRWRGPGPLRLEGEPYLELVRWRPKGTYQWSAYRGALEWEPAPGGIRLVNRLPLESYLAGVLPSEMPAWFPGEALRAQAVVARTYTRAHLGRHQEGGHDLCAGVHCQVYQGVEGEAASTSQAVSQTRGELLVEGSAPCEAFYHAVCGGMGEEPTSVWPGSSPRPYLVSRPDSLEPGGQELKGEAAVRTFLGQPSTACCAAAGRFRWQESWTLEAFQGLLEESLPRLAPGAPALGRLREIEVLSRTPGGRVRVLEIRGSGGAARVEGDRVRWITSRGRIGAGGLHSALFTVAVEGGQVRISGGGWGHGVGLCQEGAAGRARAGASYRSILDHYYPQARLVCPPPQGEDSGMGRRTASP